MKLNRKLITKYLVYVLPIVYLYFFREGRLRLIVLFFLEVSLIAWNKSKGVWVTEANYTEAKKWTKSLRFNAYVFFLLIHNIFNIYFWIVEPSYIDKDWNPLLFIYGRSLLSSIVINSLALFAFIKKVYHDKYY